MHDESQRRHSQYLCYQIRVLLLSGLVPLLDCTTHASDLLISTYTSREHQVRSSQLVCGGWYLWPCRPAGWLHSCPGPPSQRARQPASCSPAAEAQAVDDPDHETGCVDGGSLHPDCSVHSGNLAGHRSRLQGCPCAAAVGASV